MSNVTNIKHVWGEPSPQLRAAETMAAEYLRNFMGSSTEKRLKVEKDSQKRGGAAKGGAEGVFSMNLAYRPRSAS